MHYIALNAPNFWTAFKLVLHFESFSWPNWQVSLSLTCVTWLTLSSLTIDFFLFLWRLFFENENETWYSKLRCWKDRLQWSRLPIPLDVIMLFVRNLLIYCLSDVYYVINRFTLKGSTCEEPWKAFLWKMCGGLQ